MQQLGSAVQVPLATFERPLEKAAPGDFGLSFLEGRELLAALQRVVAQDQIVAYDLRRRCCRHCGSYRRIKDWRRRTFSTGLGEIQVRVQRVVSCQCLPEPLDDDDEPIDLRFSESSIESLLPARWTPELSYLCANPVASDEALTHQGAHHFICSAALASGAAQPRIKAAARDTESLAYQSQRPGQSVLRNEIEFHIDSLAK